MYYQNKPFSYTLKLHYNGKETPFPNSRELSEFFDEILNWYFGFLVVYLQYKGLVDVR